MAAAAVIRTVNRKPATISSSSYTDQLDAAIKRATATGVHVAGLGRFKAHPTRRFAIVTSASQPGRMYHVVSISDVRLTCDCEAAQHGHRVCVHVAATSMYLTARAARQRLFEEAVERALRDEQEAEEEAHLHAATQTLERVEAQLDEMDARDAQRDREGWAADNCGGAVLDCMRGWSQ